MGLYAFAATITAFDAINLARSTTLKNTIGTPTGNLESAVDAERLIAVVYLAAPVPSNLAGLQAQERKTEQAQAGFKAAAAATMNSSPSPQEKQAIAALVTDSAGLTSLRAQIAALSISRPQAIAAYANVVNAADTVLNDTILQETNVSVVTQSLALVRAGRSEELLLEEDALVNGPGRGGRSTPSPCRTCSRSTAPSTSRTSARRRRRRWTRWRTRSSPTPARAGFRRCPCRPGTWPSAPSRPGCRTRAIRRRPP
jgi:hypothetical protein